MAFDDDWSTFTASAGPVLAAALADRAPVRDTGLLAQSMVWEDEGDRLTAGSRDPRGPIARYVAFGTRGPYEIVPVFAKALHFFASDGAEVFTQHVTHPGIAGNPFHIDAFGDARTEVLGMFRDIMPKGMALAYLNPRRRVITI